MASRSIQLLAVLLTLGLCVLVGAQKPSACQCSRIAAHNRTNCGFPGITPDTCFDSGCCFSSKIPNVPWCFHPLPKQELEECVMHVSARKNCGYPGISPQECAARKCCFSDTIVNVPWCFFPISVEAHSSAQRIEDSGSLMQDGWPVETDACSFWKSCTAFAMGPGGLADLLRVRDSDTCGLQVTVWYPSVVGRVLPPHLLFEVGHLKVLVVPGATPGEVEISVSKKRALTEGDRAGTTILDFQTPEL
ncbi:trefoil factor 2 [Ursus americanus]|uniref:trefoil factor 2 n=1 Tax=Ursus americanus TaxID=9643 RepID=UPI001E67C2D3|nr:trefoil factor 2 [Ursus americanus]